LRVLTSSGGGLEQPILPLVTIKSSARRVTAKTKGWNEGEVFHFRYMRCLNCAQLSLYFVLTSAVICVDVLIS
jgi:hypothetical protein